MAQEIIAAIRKAEIEAEQTEKKALAEGAAIRQQSQKAAALLAGEMINSEQLQAETALAEAKTLSCQWLNDAEAAAEIEIRQLRERATQKETEIISLIIAELL